MKGLVESIFGNNVKSDIAVHGVKIYEPDWKFIKI